MKHTENKTIDKKKQIKECDCVCHSKLDWYTDLHKHIRKNSTVPQPLEWEEEVRQKISEILVKWSMPTRQVAILEIVALLSLERKKIVEQVEGMKHGEKWCTEVCIEINKNGVACYHELQDKALGSVLDILKGK